MILLGSAWLLTGVLTWNNIPYMRLMYHYKILIYPYNHGDDGLAPIIWSC